MMKYTWGRSWKSFSHVLTLGQGDWQVLDQFADPSQPVLVVDGISSEWQAKLIAAAMNGIPEPL